jgi:membrane protease YdiL (CAAX protease family)
MSQLKKTTWIELLLLFGIPTILNYLASQIVIPFIDGQHILPIEITYFLSVGLLVLVPMFFGALYLSGQDIGSCKLKDLFVRMRIKKISVKDLIWTICTFVFLVSTSFVIAKIIMPGLELDATPFFFQNMPLSNENFWILYIWPVFFFFNIFGEEFFWRGYIQPRQELLNKNWTWIVHGLLWAFWHLPMGVDLIFAATPIFFILPVVVQIRKNTTIAIIVHFVFGAFGFLAISLGMVQ